MGEIIGYFERFPPPYEFEDVIDVIQRMDQMYMTHSAEVMERKNARSKH